MLPAISCPRAANAARNICSSSWAAESARQSARRYVSPSRRFLLSTDQECDSRRLSTVCEFSLFPSLCHSLCPSRLILHPGKKDLAASCKPLIKFLARSASALTESGRLTATSQSPQSFQRRRCARLRESRSASLFPSPLA